LAVAEVAQQQRAEVRARPLGRGEATDDQLLPRLALELEPVPGARGPVRAVGAFGDHALPALAAGLGEHRLAHAVAVRGPAQRVVEGEGGAEQALARAQ